MGMYIYLGQKTFLPKPLQCPPRSSLIKSLSTSQLNPNMQYPAPFLHVRIWVITKTPVKYVM